MCVSFVKCFCLGSRRKRVVAFPNYSENCAIARADFPNLFIQGRVELLTYGLKYGWPPSIRVPILSVKLTYYEWWQPNGLNAPNFVAHPSSCDMCMQFKIWLGNMSIDFTCYLRHSLVIYHLHSNRCVNPSTHLIVSNSHTSTYRPYPSVDWPNYIIIAKYHSSGVHAK